MEAKKLLGVLASVAVGIGVGVAKNKLTSKDNRLEEFKSIFEEFEYTFRNSGISMETLQNEALYKQYLRLSGKLNTLRFSISIADKFDEEFSSTLADIMSEFEEIAKQSKPKEELNDDIEDILETEEYNNVIKEKSQEVIFGLIQDFAKINNIIVKDDDIRELSSLIVEVTASDERFIIENLNIDAKPKSNTNQDLCEISISYNNLIDDLNKIKNFKMQAFENKQLANYYIEEITKIQGTRLRDSEIIEEAKKFVRRLTHNEQKPISESISLEELYKQLDTINLTELSQIEVNEIIQIMRKIDCAIHGSLIENAVLEKAKTIVEKYSGQVMKDSYTLKKDIGISNLTIPELIEKLKEAKNATCGGIYIDEINEVIKELEAPIVETKSVNHANALINKFLK